MHLLSGGGEQRAASSDRGVLRSGVWAAAVPGVGLGCAGLSGRVGSHKAVLAPGVGLFYYRAWRMDRSARGCCSVGRWGGCCRAWRAGGRRVHCSPARRGQRQGHALPHVVCLCLDARLDNDGPECLILHPGWTFHSEVVLEAAAGNKKEREHTPCADEYIVFLNSS